MSANPCPAAELFQSDDGPCCLCKIESTDDGIAGEPGAPVSLIHEATSPAAYARCAGQPRFPTDAEIREGSVQLEGSGKVANSGRYDLCRSWRDRDAIRAAVNASPKARA